MGENTVVLVSCGFGGREEILTARLSKGWGFGSRSSLPPV